MCSMFVPTIDDRCKAVPQGATRALAFDGVHWADWGTKPAGEVVSKGALGVTAPGAFPRNWTNQLSTFCVVTSNLSPESVTSWI